MAQIPYIFTQLSNFVDRDYFEYLVDKSRGNYHIKSYTCWNHLMVMIWAQMTDRVSLRDIEYSLRSHRNKLYRLGMGTNVSRNTIANANAQRDVSMYRELAQRMMKKASLIKVKDEELNDMAYFFNVSGFFAGDSSTFPLDLNRYSWSTPQHNKGGLKLHLLFDLLRQIPVMCLLTGHEERDQTFMDEYPYMPGNMYVFDKAYIKTLSLHKINQRKAYFVVRHKKGMKYDIVSPHRESNDRKIYADNHIKFTNRWAKIGYPDELRLVQYYSPEKNELLLFLTNNFDLPGELIASVYKRRWDIELFFKWIKQHLHIVNFYGTSANAVMIQIYVGIITYCLIAIVADSFCFKGSIYELSRFLSTSLTEKLALPDLFRQYEVILNDRLEDGPWLFSEFE